MLCSRKRGRESHLKNQRLNPHKRHPIPLGKPLRIHDRNGRELHGGDLIEIYYGNPACPSTYRGRILEYCGSRYVHMFRDYSMWYPPYNEYALESYGKECVIPLDNGKRMHILLVEAYSA